MGKVPNMAGSAGRRRRAASLAVLLSVLAGPSRAQEPPPEAAPERGSPRPRLHLYQEYPLGEPAPRPGDRPLGLEGPPASGEPPAGDRRLGSRFQGETVETPGPLRGVYDKPFLAGLWRRAYLGGYTELEYHGFQDGILGVTRGFRAHRTNLFAYSDVADTIRFGSEIEFENEERGEPTEVRVEMAFVDWVIAEELTFRGGAILVPLGRINVNHDGPVREITDRPLVSRFVIPTTLTEAGVGARGTLRPFEKAAISYEAYATNGFQVLDRNGQLAAPVTDRELLLRDGRPSLAGDFNKDLSSCGRLSLLAFDFLELGGSYHLGTYDERSDDLLTILAADLALARGPFALEGEVARAGFERDSFARTAGVPERFWGYYLQGSVSHMPEVLKRAAPRIFGNRGAAFTLVVRYDWVDLDGDRGEAIEPGINFRPIADTVFKFSYRVSLNSVGNRNIPGRENFDDDGFVFSLATYF
jgi:hypothetical protein